MDAVWADFQRVFAHCFKQLILRLTLGIMGPVHEKSNACRSISHIPFYYFSAYSNTHPFIFFDSTE